MTDAAAPDAAAASPRFRYGWTTGRYVRMARAMDRHARGRWARAARWLAILAVLLWTTAGGLRGGITVRGVVEEVPWMAAVVVALLALYEAVRWIMAWRFLRSPRGRHEFVLWLSDEGVETDTYSGRSTLRWHALRSVVETREFLLFYVTSVHAVGLPVAAIPDDATRDAVRRELTARLGARAHLRG